MAGVSYGSKGFLAIIKTSPFKNTAERQIMIAVRLLFGNHILVSNSLICRRCCKNPSSENNCLTKPVFVSESKHLLVLL